MPDHLDFWVFLGSPYRVLCTRSLLNSVPSGSATWKYCSSQDPLANSFSTLRQRGPCTLTLTASKALRFGEATELGRGNNGHFGQRDRLGRLRRRLHESRAFLPAGLDDGLFSLIAPTQACRRQRTSRWYCRLQRISVDCLRQHTTQVCSLHLTADCPEQRLTLECRRQQVRPAYRPPQVSRGCGRAEQALRFPRLVVVGDCVGFCGISRQVCTDQGLGDERALRFRISGSERAEGCTDISRAVLNDFVPHPEPVHSAVYAVVVLESVIAFTVVCPIGCFCRFWCWRHAAC